MLRRLLNELSSDPAASHEVKRRRYVRAGLTGVSSALAKGGWWLTLALATRWTVGYLGPERYGLWMTITSLTTVLCIADLGLGNGLLNAVSEAYARDDRQAAQEFVSSAVALLAGVGVVLVGLLLMVDQFVSWSAVLKINSEAVAPEARAGMMVFGILFVFGLVLSVVQKAQLGFQEGYVSNYWQMGGAALGLGAVLIVARCRGGVPALVLALIGGQILANTANGIALFGFRRPWLKPHWRQVAWPRIGTLLNFGFPFFLLQLTYSIAWPTDNLVAAKTLGAATVPQYSIPMQLFGAIPLGMSMLLAPLWPAYGEAYARKDWSWIKRTLRFSIAGTIVLPGLFVLPLLVWGESICYWWIKTRITLPVPLLLGFGLWAVVWSTLNAIAIFLNGINWIRPQLLVAIPAAIGILAMKFVFASRWGLSGIIWANVVGAVLIGGCYILFARRVLAQECQISVPPNAEKVSL